MVGSTWNPSTWKTWSVFHVSRKQIILTYPIVTPMGFLWLLLKAGYSPLPLFLYKHCAWFITPFFFFFDDPLVMTQNESACHHLPQASYLQIISCSSWERSPLDCSYNLYRNWKWLYLNKREYWNLPFQEIFPDFLH